MKSKELIYKPEKERKIDKRAALRQERNSLLSERYKINLRLNEIKKELDIAPEQLTVTSHAVQRFKERIQNVPDKIAKKILSDPNLIEKYKISGKGRFRLTAYPEVIVVISNFTVVTCFSKKDPQMKLQDLEIYMDYYIDELIKMKLSENTWKVDSFGKFRKNCYN